MIKMMLIVVSVYSISWLPFNLVVVYADLDESIWEWSPMTYIFPIIQWLALAHTVCNPIIYCWLNARFRAGFRSAIQNLPCLRTSAHSRPFSCLRGQGLYARGRDSRFSGTPGGKWMRQSSVMSNGRTTLVHMSPSLKNFEPTDTFRRLGNDSDGNDERLSPIGIPLIHFNPNQGIEVSKTSAEVEAIDMSDPTVTPPVENSQYKKSRSRQPIRNDSMLESFL